MIVLTDSDMSHIANALRVAAEAFGTHIATLGKANNLTDHARIELTKVMEEQKRHAARYSEIFETTPHVLISSCPHCLEDIDHPTSECADRDLRRILGERV